MSTCSMLGERDSDDEKTFKALSLELAEGELADVPVGEVATLETGMHGELGDSFVDDTFLGWPVGLQDYVRGPE